MIAIEETPLNGAFSRLVGIMARLRSADGCPWDIEQDHRSLIRFLIEESYEVVEAIESGNDQELAEELGDVLLQVLFHAQIASEEDRFSIVDVLDRISEKLITRHPHVFKVKNDRLSAGEVEKNWNLLKKTKSRSFILDGIPANLPALLKALRTGERTASVGCKPKLELILRTIDILGKKLVETAEGNDRAESEAILGKLLFAIAHLAGRMKIDPEMALNGATAVFAERVRLLEKELNQTGRSFDTVDERQLNELWKTE